MCLKCFVLLCPEGLWQTVTRAVLCLVNLDRYCSSVSLSLSLSLLALYCSLHHLSLFPLFPFLHGNAMNNIWRCLVFYAVNPPWFADSTNHVWRISHLCCKFSMAWLMPQSSLVNLTHCKDEIYCFSLFMVSLTLFCGSFLKSIISPLFTMHGSLYSFLSMHAVLIRYFNYYNHQ